MLQSCDTLFKIKGNKEQALLYTERCWSLVVEVIEVNNTDFKKIRTRSGQVW